MPDHWCKVNDTTIDAKWATANTNVFLKSFELKWLDLRSASSEITMALNIMISSAWWTHSYDSFSIYLALICSQCWCKLMLITQAVYNLRWNCSIGFIAENKKPIAFETLSYSNILAWMNKLNARASSFIGKCKFSAVFFLSNENP